MAVRHPQVASPTASGTTSCTPVWPHAALLHATQGLQSLASTSCLHDLRASASEPGAVRCQSLLPVTLHPASRKGISSLQIHLSMRHAVLSVWPWLCLPGVHAHGHAALTVQLLHCHRCPSSHACTPESMSCRPGTLYALASTASTQSAAPYSTIASCLCSSTGTQHRDPRPCLPSCNS